MGNVTIGAYTYAIHGTLPGAKEYLTPSGLAAWNAGTDDAKSGWLVEATRLLYPLPWQGAPTVAAQKTAFPRDGVTDVPNGTTPDDIVSAEYILAGAIAANPALVAAVTSGSNVKRMEAGPVNIEYFHATDVSGFITASGLPKNVDDLIVKYLDTGSDGSLSAGAARAYGVDPCVDREAQSQFEDCDTRDRLVR